MIKDEPEEISNDWDDEDYNDEKMYLRKYLMMGMIMIIMMREKMNLRRYLIMGVPPSSSGGFHDSFTCSARTFSCGRLNIFYMFKHLYMWSFKHLLYV